MTHEILKQTLATLVQKQEDMKVLAKEIDKLKSIIIEAHNGEPTLICDEYQSKLTNCTRLTLLEKLVQEKYNVTFQPEDYKVTPYNRLSVSKAKA